MGNDGNECFAHRIRIPRRRPKGGWGPKQLTVIVGWSGFKEMIGSDVAAGLGSRPFGRWGRVSAVGGRVLSDWKS